MYILGVGLVRPLQPWGFLLIYHNNQLKKYIIPFLRLGKGGGGGEGVRLPVPFLMSMSEAFSVPFYTLINLCYTKALEWSSMVPSPEAKSSSSEIMNLTINHDLTIHHKLSSWGLVQGLQDKVRRLRALVSWLSQYTCFLLYLTNSVVCLCEWITHPAWSEHWACSAVWRCLVKK